jgi:hypothetical protein
MSSITSILMMEAETVSETLDCNSILTRLIARKYSISFGHRESFKSYLRYIAGSQKNAVIS